MRHADWLDSWSEDQIEQARRDRDLERAERHAELLQRDELEDPATEEAVWAHRMKAWAETREAVHYVEDKRGIDRRSFGP